MDFSQMKHTCWRCLHSEIVTGPDDKPQLICGLPSRTPEKDWNAETTCGSWAWNSTTKRYLTGHLPKNIHNTLTAIYKERMRNGTF